MRRENIALKEDRKTLLIEDDREDRELQNYVIKALAAEFGKMMPFQDEAQVEESAKLRERQSGTEEWRVARGEANPSAGPG